MTETLEAIRRNAALTLVGCIALLLGALHPAFDRLGETRLWRDLAARTPFHSVLVTSSDLVPGGAALAGEMVKRRCEYRGLSAYIHASGVWQRARIDTAPEDARRPPGDRPAVPGAQLWGPWVIRWQSPPVPVEWAIYAHHTCPESGQINLFARGLWPG